MGNKLIRVIEEILIIICCLLATIEVKAEVAIEIKIPDEIKIKPEEKEGQNPLITPVVDLSGDDMIVLQKIAIAEAKDIGSQGMAYVMQTVINRVDNEDFPDNIESVIKQKGQFSTYPDKYNKAVPNEESAYALELLEINNQGQLFFENPSPGSWQSKNRELAFTYKGLNFYK